MTHGNKTTLLNSTSAHFSIVCTTKLIAVSKSVRYIKIYDLSSAHSFEFKFSPRRHCLIILFILEEDNRPLSKLYKQQISFTSTFSTFVLCAQLYSCCVHMCVRTRNKEVLDITFAFFCVFEFLKPGKL